MSNNDAQSQRSYSLFGNHTAIGNSSIANLFNNNPNHNEGGAFGQSRRFMSRRSTCEAMTKGVCQRCQRFEVDLTNTSDNLSATDAELKASRQVISLLQRQLELFRVEKEGLERLIISQSTKPLRLDAPTPSCSADIPPDENLALIDLSKDEKGTVKAEETEKSNLGTAQQMLLDLIRTDLHSKDEEIVRLKFALKEAQNDKEQLALQVHNLEEDIATLKNENTVLNENLTLRDQTIVSLSNEVFEQGNIDELSKLHRRQSCADPSSTQSLAKYQRNIAKLIDTLDAYKKTNELLSNNVMKLTDRCGQAEKKEIETRSQCHELEAKCCQIQSKLLSLLKEIEQSSKQNGSDAAKQSDYSESVKILIERLLEDKSLDIPLSWKEGNRSSRGAKEDSVKSNSKYECDELGFYIIVDETKEGSDCNAPSQSSKVRRSFNNSGEETQMSTTQLATVDEAGEITQSNPEVNDRVRRICSTQLSVDSTKSDETRWHLRWDNFIKDFDKVDLNKSKEFKNLLRSGVPQEYRCKIWKALVDLNVGRSRQQYGPDYYQSLLKPNKPHNNSKKALNPSSKQIELDLLRTLPNNKHFETLDSSGTVRLRRVLTAYSEHNPKVGYCQGMNRLAAVALLVLPEEEAFWCLVTIIDRIMPDSYYNDLWLAQVDSAVVMDFVATKLPNLNEHFKENGIELSLFAWFLTIFVDGTPPALFLRLWDCFLYEGDKILFRVALALLKMHEKDLLQINNSVGVNNFLRSAVNAPMNIDQFFEIAFDWINPLSTRSLRAKRQQNFANVHRFSTMSPSNSYGDRWNSKDDSANEDSSIISI